MFTTSCKQRKDQSYEQGNISFVVSLCLSTTAEFMKPELDVP